MYGQCGHFCWSFAGAYAALAGIAPCSEGANVAKRPDPALAQQPRSAHNNSTLDTTQQEGTAQEPLQHVGAPGGQPHGSIAVAAAVAGVPGGVLEPVIDSSKAPLDALEDALDWMCFSNRAFLGQYVVLGSAERRRGGQGVVQFMRRCACSVCRVYACFDLLLVACRPFCLIWFESS